MRAMSRGIRLDDSLRYNSMSAIDKIVKDFVKKIRKLETIELANIENASYHRGEAKKCENDTARAHRIRVKLAGIVE